MAVSRQLSPITPDGLGRLRTDRVQRPSSICLQPKRGVWLQSDLAHVNYHADLFLRPENDSYPRFPTAEMEYIGL